MDYSDTQMIGIVGGVLVPIIVGIIAKLNAPSGLKAILNAALSALTSVLAQIIPGSFQWRPFIVTWALTWVVSVATYYGLWKPTGIAPAVQNSTSSVGIG